MTHLRKLVLALLAALALKAVPARAVCNQSTASQADRDLWNTHGCWQAFFLWQYKAYDMSGSDWGGRGWDDACNVNKEYPKHWNAAYLLTYGLQDNNSFSFHGTVDYRGTAERWDNAYHDDLYHAPTDDTSIFGSWSYHFFGSNEVDTSCLLYDPNLRPNSNSSVTSRTFPRRGCLTASAWPHRRTLTNGPLRGSSTALAISVGARGPGRLAGTSGSRLCSVRVRHGPPLFFS